MAAVGTPLGISLQVAKTLTAGQVFAKAELVMFFTKTIWCLLPQNDCQPIQTSAMLPTDCWISVGDLALVYWVCAVSKMRCWMTHVSLNVHHSTVHQDVS